MCAVVRPNPSSWRRQLSEIIGHPPFRADDIRITALLQRIGSIDAQLRQSTRSTAGRFRKMVYAACPIMNKRTCGTIGDFVR
jgi:hypothetical protein